MEKEPMTQKERIEAFLREVEWPAYYENYGEWHCFRPDLDMYGEIKVDFDFLLALADAAGTKEINLRYNEGWAGTEVTAGDPSEFGLFIKKVNP